MKQGFRWIHIAGPLYVLLSGLLAVSVLASSLCGIPIDRFMRDPAWMTGANPFLGVMSYVGILMWTAMISVSTFVWFYLKGDPDRQKEAGFFLSSAVFTTILLVDDIFMFHEYIFPYWLEVRSYFLYAFYLAALIGIAVYYRKVILQTRFQVLAFAFIILGLSWLIDRIPEVSVWHDFWEDSFKLFGIATWAGYYCDAGMQQLSPRPSLGNRFEGQKPL